VHIECTNAWCCCCYQEEEREEALRETQALPSVYGFAEGLLSGTRQS
jgi:hypothetical protein